MFVIHRYIALNVIRGFFFVGLVLISLFAIILLIDELDDVGTGTYTWGLAIHYVLLNTPRLLLDFATFISLVGSIVALGTLAGNQELVAIESLGGTPREVTWSVIATAVFLMLIVLLIAQFVIPVTLHKANVEKTLATESYGDFVSETGYWSQVDGRFLHVGSIENGRTPIDIEIYEFDQQHQLKRSIIAAYADLNDSNVWKLRDVVLRELVAGRLEINKIDDLEWSSFLNTTQLNVIVVQPEALSLTDLYIYIQGLKQRGEQSYRYELVLWQRLMNPIAAAIMIFLGMRFVFGSQRHVAMGKRIVLGVLTGIAFYVFSQFVTHTGTISRIAPEIVAVTPSAVVLSLILIASHYKKLLRIVSD